MEEQLITKETAKIANEKGFNIPCWNFIDVTGQEESVIGWVGDTFEEKLEQMEDFVKYYRPTQSLLQKYLRDKHGISVIADTDETLSWIFTIQSLCPEASYVGDYIHSMYCFSSFEEALEAGLFQALKLIK